MESTPRPIPPPRGHRAHPARSTRRAVGAASVGATLALAGGMAVTAHHNPTTTAAATSASATTPTTAASSSATDSESDDATSSANSSVFGSISTPAQSGVASSQAVTSTNAS